MKVERRKKIRLGELLIEQKVINEEQLNKALAEQKRTGRKLGRVLTDLGIVEEQQLNDALARHLQIPFVDLKQLTLDQNSGAPAARSPGAPLPRAGAAAGQELA